MTKVCIDPCCSEVAHNVTVRKRQCNNCGGRLVRVDDSWLEKHKDQVYFHVDYETGETLWGGGRH